MQQKIQSNNITWINIVNPDKKDVQFLKEEFELCPSILKEYIPRIKRPKVEEYKDYLFVVIHFPVFNRKTKKTVSIEFDIILFENILITSCTGSFPELKKVFEKCGVNEQVRDYYMEKNAVCLIYKILDKLIDTRMPMLDHIDDRLEEMEEEIFNGNERKMVGEVAIVKHDIISFRKIVKPQRVVLESLIRTATKITGGNLTRTSAEVIGSNVKIWHTLENYKETIEALEHTNESLLSYKLGDTMKVLTAFSVIVLPLSLIANAFGMNVTNGMPFLGLQNGFWIIVIFMSSITFISFLFFRFKKWL
jgi:magnesium transporter